MQRNSSYTGSGVLALVTLMVMVFTVPLVASGVTLGAGWTHSDVGLHNNGDGFYLGVGNDIPLNSKIFDANYSFDYVQKKGSQPTPFFDPVGGFITEDAEVTLHVLQPSVFLGAKMADWSLVPRIYTGGSIGLKLKESWSDFPGVPDQSYGYKETDVVFHLGASLSLGAVALDVRWSKSMVGQLIKDPQEVLLDQPGKATDLMPDVKAPEAGHKTEVVQLGLVYSF